MNLIYATDMDRTVIYSKKFLNEYKPNCKYEVVEKKEEDEISYISTEVKEKLKRLNKGLNLKIVPVTTRSIEEFNRIDLGFKTKYAIVSNGGVILENGKPIKEWEDYIKENIKLADLMLASIDLEDLGSTIRDTKIIDGKYLFNKVENTELFDIEVAVLKERYTSLDFVRQRNKVYAVPKVFSKAIALRWLQNRIKADTLVVSGDSELDLPMLAIANYAIIPKHGNLYKEGYVVDGRLAEEGINSPLYTIDLVNKLLNN